MQLTILDRNSASSLDTLIYTECTPVPDRGYVTELLHKWRAGSPDAENELFSLVLPELRRLARYMMKGERPGHSLQATELVDEIYFRLANAKNIDWRDRRHFFAIAGRAMRRYLIDHARGRPDAQFVTLEGMQQLVPAGGHIPELAITIDRLLEQLAGLEPEWCTIVELKYFLGMTDEETAEALGLKLRTMQRMWLDARKWLFQHLESSSAAQSTGQ